MKGSAASWLPVDNLYPTFSLDDSQSYILSEIRLQNDVLKIGAGMKPGPGLVKNEDRGLIIKVLTRRVEVELSRTRREGAGQTKPARRIDL